MNNKVYREIKHGRFLAQQNTESIWGWDTPAGRLRAKRRGEMIATAAGLKPGLRVLEIGCGTGLFTEIFAKFGVDLIAIDISAELIEKARNRNINGNVVFVEGRFEDNDLEGEFDAVIGSSVLHHLELEPALKKIYSLLKPGGFLSFAEPNQLNPQVFFMFKFRTLFPEVSPDENPFLRWRLQRELTASGFTSPVIKPFDWLHPSTAPALIKSVSRLGIFLEKCPVLCEFAGSLLIKAVKPA